MFVLSKEQFHTLVDEKQEKYENWLDLGAGDGGALERLGVKVRKYRFFCISRYFLGYGLNGLDNRDLWSDEKAFRMERIQHKRRRKMG